MGFNHAGDLPWFREYSEILWSVSMVPGYIHASRIAISPMLDIMRNSGDIRIL